MSNGTIVDRGVSWQLRWRQGGRTHVQALRKDTAPLKSDAQRKLRELLTRADHGRSAPSRESFEAWCREWLSAVKISISPISLRLYTTQAENHLIPAFGGYKLRALDKVTIRAEWARLSETLAASSLHVLHRVLSSCLGYAVEVGRLDFNPCSGWRTGLPKLNDAERPILSTSEARNLIEAARRGPTTGSYAGQGWLLFPIVLALGCGMRRGEICALTWDRINLETGEITIAESIRELSAKDRRRGKTKTGKTRRPVLPAWALAELKGDGTVVRLRRGAVCMKPDGTPITPNSLTDAFAHLAGAIGRPEVVFHDLRHCCASWALAAGGSIKDVQIMLGHAKPSITLNTYSHAMQGSASGLAAKLNDAMTG